MNPHNPFSRFDQSFYACSYRYWILSFKKGKEGWHKKATPCTPRVYGDI